MQDQYRGRTEQVKEIASSPRDVEAGKRTATASHSKPDAIGPQSRNDEDCVVARLQRSRERAHASLHTSSKVRGPVESADTLDASQTSSDRTSSVQNRTNGDRSRTVEAVPVQDEKLTEQGLPSGRIAGMRERIRRFAPSWYSVTMGTGIISTLVTLLPWESTKAAMRIIGLIYLVLDIVIFTVFNILTIMRFTMFPYIFGLMINHPTYSLFLGTYPMSLTTIISNLTLFQYYGASNGVLYAASSLWWLTSFIGLLTAIGVPYAMVTRHHITISGLTAAWLLPIVPPITAASVGATFAQTFVTIHPSYSLVIMLASYVQLGIGVPLAMAVLVLYLYRLAVHKLPPSEVIVSVFLPLGPTGQGGYAFLRLGKVAQQLFPIISSPSYTSSPAIEALGNSVGDGMYAVGIITALVLWALGVWWLFIAVISFFTKVIYYEQQDLDSFRDPALGSDTFNDDEHGSTSRMRRLIKTRANVSRDKQKRRSGSRPRPHLKIPLNLGWWGFVFPLGSLCLCTLALGEDFNSTFFNVIGTGMTIACVLLWVVCIVPTVQGAISGRVNVWAAPCLTDLPSSR